MASVSGRYVVGTVVRLSTVGRHTSAAKPIASVRIPQNEYNPVLKMYFAASEDRWAMLNQVTCNIGDQVLCQMSDTDIDTPLARDVSCVVHRVTREFGNPKDPVTNRTAYKELDDEREDVFREQRDERTQTIKNLLNQ